MNNQKEDRVEDALRILFNDLGRIIVLADSGEPQDSRSSILLDTKKKRRIPFSELGEGANRLLALGVALGCSENGLLLIDEIDTGLHYTVLADMWRMVIKSAQELDLQVIATTHSSDCLRALRDAVEADAGLADEVATYSIDRRVDEAVRFDGSELGVIVDNEIEVR